jgi:VanZ family protein
MNMTATSVDRTILLSRILFWITLTAVFFLAFSPNADIGPDFDQADKIKHAFAFSVLTLLYAFGYSTESIVVAGRMLLVGLFIEAVQYTLPYRDASALQVAADAARIVVALLIIRKKRKIKSLS